MVLNTTLRRFRVWLCKPGENESSGLEITDAFSGEGTFLSITDEPISEEGLFRTTGQAVLLVPRGREHVYDPWNNEARWAPGNHLIIKVADQAGTLRPHPRSYLFLASFPLPAYPGSPTITLELVDLLTLKSYRVPDEDKTNVPPGSLVGVPFTEIITKLLQSAEIPFFGNVPGILHYSTPKTQESFVHQAGVFAWCGLSGLWQNNHGTIYAKLLNLSPPQRLFKHTVGIDDAADFQLRQGAELPVVVVKASGTGYRMKRFNNGDEKKTEEYGAKETVEEGAGSQNILLSRRIERSRWDSANKFVREIEESKCRGLIVTQDLYDIFQKKNGTLFGIPSPFAFYPSLSAKEVSTYESDKEGSEGKLLKKEYTAYAPRGYVMGDYLRNNMETSSNFLQPMLAEHTITTYEYDGGACIKTETKKYEPVGKIAGRATFKRTFVNDFGLTVTEISSVPVDTLSLSEYQLIEYEEKAKDNEWLRHEVQRKAGQISKGYVSAFLAPRTVLDEIIDSRSGDAQPPAAERKRPSLERIEQQYKGEARFASPSGSSFIPREYSTQVEYPYDPSQCNTIAKIVGTLRMARHRGFRITTAMRDEWFSYQPLSRIDIQWGNKIYKGITDLVQWVLADNQVIVVADCMRSGATTGNAAGLIPIFDLIVGTDPDGLATGAGAVGSALDPYAYADLPPLQPTDPDPTPIPDVPATVVVAPETPDGESGEVTVALPVPEQPFFPIIQIVQSLQSEVKREVEFTQLNYIPNEVLPLVTMTIELKREVQFFNQLFVAEFKREIEFTQLQILQSTLAREIQFTPEEPTGGGGSGTSLTLAHSWAMDTTSWTDSVGGYNLTQDGDGGVTIANVGGSNVTKFSGDLDEGLYYEPRLVSASSLAEFGFGDSNWRLEFEIRFTSTSSSGSNKIDIFAFESSNTNRWQLQCTFADGLLNVILSRGGTSSSGQNSTYIFYPNTGSGAPSLTANAWHSVAVEYKADTNELVLTVNGYNSIETAASTPEIVSNPRLVLGAIVFAGYTYIGNSYYLRNVKLYR